MRRDCTQRIDPSLKSSDKELLLRLTRRRQLCVKKHHVLVSAFVVWRSVVCLVSTVVSCFRLPVSFLFYLKADLVSVKFWMFQEGFSLSFMSGGVYCVRDWGHFSFTPFTESWLRSLIVPVCVVITDVRFFTLTALFSHHIYSSVALVSTPMRYFVG